MATETIYMPLLDEGTTAWAPVLGELLADGRFRVLGPMPDDQEWAFAPGSVVAVQRMIFSGGEEGMAVTEISV